MCPRANQPGRFFTTAKTQKFEFIEDISLGSPKSCPIVDQTETYKKSFLFKINIEKAAIEIN